VVVRADPKLLSKREMATVGKVAIAKPTMDRILFEYTCLGVEAPILELRDASLELLIPLGLIRKERKSSVYVVVNPCNRYGDGLVPGHSVWLACSFSKDGFSLKEFGIPLATEVPPRTDPRYKEIVAWNQKLVTDSNGVLPPLEESHFVLMSVHQP